MNIADATRELRQTVRALVKRPVFASVVVLVLALGIGATTTIFTLVDAILLSPLPFPEPDRLVSLSHSAPNVGRGDVGQCAAWHVTYQEEGRVFDGLGMYAFGRVDITGDGEPDAPRSMVATSGVFSTLGMQPVIGRPFTPADENPDAPPVILLTHGYWQTRFGGDRAVVGRTMRVNGNPTEIVGVLPPTLSTLGQDPSVVVPLRYRRADLFVGNVGFSSVARLKPGVTREQAIADMKRMLPMAFEKFPGGPVIEAARQANYLPNAVPLTETLVGGVARVLWVLLAGVAVVLLVACANIANLFLVRAESKRKEMAIRTALGATRLRVAWEHLRESVVLGLIGGAAGLAMAYAGLRILAARAPSQLPRLDEVAIDSSALLFTLAVAAGAGLVFGLLPMLKQDPRGVSETLKAGGHSGVGGGGRHRIQNLLAVSQIALVFVLLVGSGLVLRSANALWKTDPGFRDPAHLLALSVRINSRNVPQDAGVALQQEAIARQLAQIAGVDGVAIATALPAHAGGNINPLYVEGITDAGTAPPITRRHKWVGEGYFDTLGIPVLKGRPLTWQDAHDRAPVVLVSRSIALAYWGSVDEAIGKRISVRPNPLRWAEVVGVVEDVRDDGVNVDPPAMVYWPQVTAAFWEGEGADDLLVWRSASYAIRSRRVGTPGLLDDVRRAIWSVNPNLPLSNVGTLDDYVAQSVSPTTFALVLLSIAAGIALVLGLVGVYGVISFAVSQRTRELGIRMALGADARRVRIMVLRHGLALAVAGTFLGLTLALGGTRIMEGLLFGVTPADPLTFGAVAAGLTFVAVAAAWIPAYRASRVDPLVVLRAE
jgi:predicted permease